MVKEEEGEDEEGVSHVMEAPADPGGALERPGQQVAKIHHGTTEIQIQIQIQIQILGIPTEVTQTSEQAAKAANKILIGNAPPKVWIP